MDSDSGVMRYINNGIVKTPEETWKGIWLPWPIWKIFSRSESCNGQASLTRQ